MKNYSSGYSGVRCTSQSSIWQISSIQWKVWFVSLLHKFEFHLLYAPWEFFRYCHAGYLELLFGKVCVRLVWH